MGDDGVAYVEFDLQWLRYVHVATANHEFTNHWGRRMEEILILIGLVEVKEKSNRMTLYKGTLMDEGLGDDEPQVESTRIPLTMKIANDTTFGMDALLDPGVSHNFISFEALQTLPKGCMVHKCDRAINGT